MTEESHAVCLLQECTAPVSRRGWCLAHYYRWLRHANPRGGVGFAPGVSLEHRIASQTDRSGGPDACWPWRSCNDKGYSQMRWQGKTQYVTHLVYQIAHGHPPEKPFVCHSCDTPLCINPKHLWAGTHEDNMRDMVSKERADKTPRLGEQHWNAKLTEEQLREIREQSTAGRSAAVLAAEYGITTDNLRLILRRKIWRHVA